MNKILLILLLILQSLRINAQNQITGKVLDEQNLPIPGASVFLPDLNKGTLTDSLGRFIMENLPMNKVKIQVAFMGYNTEIKTITVKEGGNPVEIRLTIAVIESQEVVISGGLINSQHETAVKIDVLKNRDISFSGSPNFMESLTKVPGVDMIAKGQGVSKPVIRGLSMNDILVLNNGIRMENYQFSENHPLGINDLDVDRVEIIKGPASLLYGSDAIGGVINFIKEKPASIGKIIGDYQMQLDSNTMGINNSFGIKGATKFVFAGISMGTKSHADYLQGGAGFVPNSRFNEWSVSANLGYTGKSGIYKIFYDYFKQKLGMTLPAVVPMIYEQARTNEIWYQDLEHHLISSQNKLFLGKFKWENNVAFQNASRKLRTILELPVVEMSLNTFSYESRLFLPSGDNSEYVVGVQGMLQTNTNYNNRIAQFLPNAFINNVGFLFLGQYSLTDQIKLHAGLRFDILHTETEELGIAGAEDYHSPVLNNSNSTSGSIGFTFNVNKNLIIRSNLAKAYRSPNISELTSNGMHGNRFERGNEELKPEDAYQMDLSLHFHGKFLSFDIAGFYNHINNYIFISPSLDTTSSGLIIYRFSQTNAIMFGGEAGLHFHPKKLSWLHMLSTFSLVNGVQDNELNLPFMPAPKFRYEIRAEKDNLGVLIKPQVKLSALTALAQQKPSPFETFTESYTILNISFSAEMHLLGQLINIGVSVTNLLDTPYFDHLSTLKSMNYYNQGRNFSLCLKIPVNLK